ncbi:nuclease-related domain-containing protein [Kordia jejudonensis]|uniref:nuclease-related domain-containing protein n=1 Tax=Kordia jejudonensis TaxID=1348245 RepID=UPI0009E567C4
MNKIKRLRNTEDIVLNNILLKTNNSTAQIDRIIICKSGIILIDSKNYSGWIHGMKILNRNETVF